MKRQQDCVTANQDIRYKSVRLVTDQDSTVMSTASAMNIARANNLDLVMINEQADPPICKILELNKFLYEKKIKDKEIAKSQRDSRVIVKEVQFKPNIDDHDFETKCRKITKFIEKGNKVKILIQFRGREQQRTDIGYEILNRIIKTVESVELDGKSQLSGNRITAILKGITNGV